MRPVKRGKGMRPADRWAHNARPLGGLEGGVMRCKVVAVIARAARCSVTASRGGSSSSLSAVFTRRLRCLSALFFAASSCARLLVPADMKVESKSEICTFLEKENLIYL